MAKTVYEKNDCIDKHGSGTKTAPKSTFYMRTNALSDLAFVSVQELPGIM